MQPQTKLDPITETALRSLNDIVSPTPVSWLPQTWGWAVLAALLAIALLAWLVFALLRYRRNAYRREALRLLASIEQDMEAPADNRKNLDLVAELLKRTALAAWPREKVAGATGADWISFLGSSEGQEIGGALSRFLREAEYRSDTAALGLSPNDVDDIVQDARRWIEGHHVPA